ncbi:hypothetical protein C5167_000116 [Papaver somniferum]|uniref:Uncharacterized protein n=1 Tax=Papaver somniferum TaxID=3469 RepID=A0A4Y7KUE4_PAPSO|nr:hypothetical protein C5167_000116 [Papaver somniferum]
MTKLKTIFFVVDSENQHQDQSVQFRSKPRNGRSGFASVIKRRRRDGLGREAKRVLRPEQFWKSST